MNILELLFILFIGISTILWINRLEKEKCECSEDSRRSQIKNWWIFMVIFSTFLYLISFLINDNDVIKIISGIVAFINLIFVIISFIYILNLRKKKCECSDTAGQKILYIYDIIALLFLGFAIITLVIGIPTIMMLSNNKKTKK